MSSSQFGKNDAAFFADLFRDYRNRMEAVAPFQAGIEREGIYIPGAEKVKQLYDQAESDGWIKWYEKDAYRIKREDFDKWFVSEDWEQ